MAETERGRSYFHQDRGWNDHPDGALLRLDSSVSWSERGEAQALFFRRTGANSNWQAVLEPEELEGLQRGLVWETWKTKVGGSEARVFRGIRAIDEDLAQLLFEDIIPLGLDGVALHTPSDAGFLFILKIQDAQEFSRRVIKEQQGSVKPVAPGEGLAMTLLGVMKNENDTLRRLRSEDADALRRAREKDFSGLPAFKQRNAAALLLFDRFASLGREIDRALAHLRRSERSEEEQLGAELLARESRQVRQGVLLEREARDAEASEISYLQAVALGSAAPLDPALRRGAALEVGLAAQRAGYTVTETEGGIEIKIGSATLKLGPQFEIEN